MGLDEQITEAVTDGEARAETRRLLRAADHGAMTIARYHHNLAACKVPEEVRLELVQSLAFTWWSKALGLTCCHEAESGG